MVELDADNSKTADLEHNVFRRLFSLQNEINQLFGWVLSKRVSREERAITSKHAFIPPIDIYDSEKSYKIMVELPGLKPTNVQVDIENGFLNLKGTRKSITEDKVENFIIRETNFGSFYRSFPLPDNVDILKKCRTKLVDGILTIDLPKLDKSMLKKRKILIKTK